MSVCVNPQVTRRARHVQEGFLAWYNGPAVTRHTAPDVPAEIAREVRARAEPFAKWVSTAAEEEEEGDEEDE